MLSNQQKHVGKPALIPVLSCEDCHTVSLKAAPPTHHENEVNISRARRDGASLASSSSSEIANFTVNYLGEKTAKATHREKKEAINPDLKQGIETSSYLLRYDYFTVNVGHFRPSILRMSRRNPGRRSVPSSMIAIHRSDFTGYVNLMQQDVAERTPDASRSPVWAMRSRVFLAKAPAWIYPLMISNT